MRRIFLVLLVLAFFASCATVPVAQREGRIERLLDTLNEGEFEELLPATGTPFLLDREIIILDRDVETMWTNLRDVGFTFAEYRILAVEQLDQESYRRFADGFEVETYFAKYLPEGAALVEVETTHGRFLLLTGGRDSGRPLLYGMRGPI